MLVEMAIKGLMVDPVTNMPIVLLRDADNQRVLPIWVGPVEANAIALQIENVAPPRPMTHDLFRNVLAELGATLERVVISDLRESTFFAYLELRRDLPAVGKRIESVKGNGEVVSQSLLKQTVRVRRDEDGEVFDVTLDELVERRQDG